jgi:hypothetical protein
MCAALLDLLWLSLYVTLMRLLGYRIRRVRAARATPPAAHPRTQVQPSAPARPRRTHRYIDREMCLGLLARIDRAVTPASTQPSAVPAAAPAGNPPLPRAASRPQTAPPSG